jgi:patatin-related protein
MTTQAYPKPEFQRELRLGLVVYGGVSLAVYMNGICREFYNAVRGRGIYKLVKALTDADIVVDIISGTSAGGINGVLLSYALANSSAEEVVDFAAFASIWRESGNIRRLLRQPTEEEENRDSLFDGETYYQDELAAAFRSAQLQKKTAPADEWYSELNELDLFVTGTDLIGRVYSVFDDTGAAIEVKDHRALFHLKHRQGRKMPFAPQTKNPEITYKALGKLCRITSCFPVAFPTVTVRLQACEETEDECLVEWGALNNRLLPKTCPAGGYQLHFVDGGVLDNRPFSPTIKAMYYRTANRPVERKLLYIDPSPDRFTQGQVFQEMQKPNVWQVVQDSLVGMPTYESITNDLEAIADRNEKVQRYHSLLADAEAPLPQTVATRSLESQNLQEGIYLLSRLISLRDRVLPLVLGLDRTRDFTSETSEQELLLEKIAQLLIQPISQREKIDAQQNLRIVSEQIRDLDLDYALRKHWYIIQKLHRLLERVRNVTEYQKIRLLIERLNRQIKLLEVVSAALEQLLSHPEVTRCFYQLIHQNPTAADDKELRDRIYSLLIHLHRVLLDADGRELALLQQNDAENGYNLPSIFQGLPARAEQLSVTSEYNKLTPEIVDWLPQNEISEILAQFQHKNQRLEHQFSEILQLNLPVESCDNQHSFLRGIEQASQIILQSSDLKNVDYLVGCFQEFRDLDKVLYPFEYLTNIAEKQPIKIIRISPGDAQMGFGKGKGLDEKLAGNTLSAFGGFFKKSWRANDILWGRLDGLNRLLEATLTRESLSNFPRFLRKQARAQGIDEEAPEFEGFKQKYFEFLLETAFPNITASDRAKLQSHLENLADPGINLADAELQQILDDLVLEGQREIINTDLLAVIEDEIAEQIDWNYQTVAPNDPNELANRADAKNEFLQDFFKSNPKPRYDLVRGYFENNVSVLAAAAIAKESLDNFPGSKEEFFRTQYRVGKETLLDNIPPLILVNLATRSTLVLRDILNTLLGKNAKRVRQSVPYQLLDRALQLFYRWLQFKGPFALKSPNSSRSRKGRLLVQICQIILFFIVILCAILIATNSPRLIIAAVICTALGWLLGNPWKQ